MRKSVLFMRREKSDSRRKLASRVAFWVFETKKRHYSEEELEGEQVRKDEEDGERYNRPSFGELKTSHFVSTLTIKCLSDPRLNI